MAEGGAGAEMREKLHATSDLAAAITETFSLPQNPRRPVSHPEILRKSGNHAPTITSLFSMREPHFRRFDRSVKHAT